MIAVLKEAATGLVVILGIALGLTVLVAGITYVLAAIAVATSLWVVGGLLVLALFVVLLYIAWLDA
jgi:hypothetical protein